MSASRSFPPHSNVSAALRFSAPKASLSSSPWPTAMSRHLCRRKQKAILHVPVGPTGQAQTLKDCQSGAGAGILRLQVWPGLCHAGLQAGRPGASIQVVVTDFRTLYQSDVKGTPIDEIPMMQNVRGLKGHGSHPERQWGGFPGLKEWVSVLAPTVPACPLPEVSTAVHGPHFSIHTTPDNSAGSWAA